MDDFKIGDNVEEQTPELINKKIKNKRNKAIIIVVILSLIIGLTTFLVSNAIFNKKEPLPEPNNNLSLEDENVQILYEYVTYGTKGIRNDKFVKNNTVTMDSFTNEEKFYYALQFVQAEDFDYTGKLNNNNKKIYLITNKKIRKYMQLFFGPTIKYSNDIELKYPFSFRINKMNVGEMKYSIEQDGFETTFESYEPDINKDELQEDYVGELISAKTNEVNDIILEEKLVYTTIKTNPNQTYTIEVYKDKNKEILLDTKTVSGINNNYIDLSSYDNTSTIKYTFSLNNSTYYFKSSEIIT